MSNQTNVLIFEDNVAFSLELAEACERQGAAAFEAPNEEVVDAVLRARVIDLAIVDLFFETNGKLAAAGGSVIKLIRDFARLTGHRIPIVMISGSTVFSGDDEEDEIIWRSLGADYLIRKPVSAIDAVATALRIAKR